MARGGELKKVSNLFSKYKERLRPPQDSVITEFIDVVVDLVGFSVRKDDVSYVLHSKVLYLKSPAVIKQEILMNKKDILNHLRGRLGDNSSPVDIV